MINWQVIANAITDATSKRFEVAQATPLSGGCINQAYRIHSQDQQCFFIKLNAADKHPMFAAESAGLGEIAATNTVRVPHPVAHGVAQTYSFLVLENIELGGHGNAALLGQQLAALHRNCAPKFGFVFANTIGETPQINNWQTDWITFWREQRLGFQLTLAARNGYGGRLQMLGQQVMERLPPSALVR